VYRYRIEKKPQMMVLEPFNDPMTLDYIDIIGNILEFILVTVIVYFM